MAPAYDLAIKQAGASVVAPPDDPLDSLPPDALALYKQRECGLLEAELFLGTTQPKCDENGVPVEPGNAFRARAKSYTRRMQRIRARGVCDAANLLPRMVEGGYTEIPCVKVGHYVVNTHMLVWMKYPLISPW